MTNLQSLAIITTMRNEAKNLTELFKTYKNLCDSFGYVFQFVIVDNWWIWEWIEGRSPSN
jgi:hypothetical protein